MVLAPVSHAGRFTLRGQERHVRGFPCRRSKREEEEEEGQGSGLWERGVHLASRSALWRALSHASLPSYAPLSHTALLCAAACAHAQIAVMREGAIFGESALSSEYAFRQATVMATSPNTVYALAPPSIDGGLPTCVDAVDPRDGHSTLNERRCLPLFAGVVRAQKAGFQRDAWRF